MDKKNEYMFLACIEEYKALRSEILEFEKQLFQSVSLYLTVIIGSIGFILGKIMVENIQVDNVLSNPIVSGLLLTVPILIFAFSVLVITYDIEIQAASLYILILGKKIQELASRKDTVFGWESVSHRPRIAVAFEGIAFAAMALIGLAVDITVLTLSRPVSYGRILQPLYLASLSCTVLYVFALGVVIIVTSYYGRKEVQLDVPTIQTHN